MITVLHGDEEFRRSRTLAQLRAQVLSDPGLGNLNLTVLELPVDVSRLREEADAIPFLGATRMVEVHGWLTALYEERKRERSREQVKVLQAYLPRVPETTHLVFVEPRLLAKDHPLLPVLNDLKEEGRAEIHAFTLPKNVLERRKAVSTFLEEEARRLEITLDPEARQLLVQILEPNLRLMSQELEKLRTFVGPDGYVTAEMVKELVPYTQEANIFHMLNALREGQTDKAIVLLQQALRSGQHPLQILSLIARQYRIYIGVKELLEEGHSDHDIATALRIPPWTLNREKKFVRRIPWSFLERVMERLLEIDAHIKQGETAADIVLYTFVLELGNALQKRRTKHTRR